jgi:hypothetical protein
MYFRNLFVKILTSFSSNIYYDRYIATAVYWINKKEASEINKREAHGQQEARIVNKR